MRKQWLVAAVAAVLMAPAARAVVLQEGDILIADYTLPGVIRIDPATGAQAVVAQGGLIGDGHDFPQGITADLALQRIYLGMTNDERVLAIEASDGAQSIASSDASLGQLRAILLEGDGTLLVADSGRLVRIDPDGGAITPLAGDLPGAVGLVRESSGDVLVAGFAASGAQFGFDGFLARVGLPSGDVTPIVAAGTTLRDPSGVALGPQGEILLSDTSNDAVYRVDPQDGSLTPLLAGNQPQSIAVDPQGRLLVLENYTEIVRYDLDTLTPDPIVGTGGTFAGAEQFTVVRALEPADLAPVALLVLAGVARRRISCVWLERGIVAALEAKLQSMRLRAGPAPQGDPARFRT